LFSWLLAVGVLFLFFLVCALCGWVRPLLVFGGFVGGGSSFSPTLPGTFCTACFLLHTPCLLSPLLLPYYARSIVPLVSLSSRCPVPLQDLYLSRLFRYFSLSFSILNVLTALFPLLPLQWQEEYLRFFLRSRTPRSPPPTFFYYARTRWTCLSSYSPPTRSFALRSTPRKL